MCIHGQVEVLKLTQLIGMLREKHWLLNWLHCFLHWGWFPGPAWHHLMPCAPVRMWTKGCKTMSESASADQQHWRESYACLRGRTVHQAGDTGSSEIIASCSHGYRPRPALSKLVGRTPSQVLSFNTQAPPEQDPVCCVVLCCKARVGRPCCMWAWESNLPAQSSVMFCINGLAPWSKRPLSC